MSKVRFSLLIATLAFAIAVQAIQADASSLRYRETAEAPNGPAAWHGQRRTNRDLAEEVRHQLVMLPYYSLFDWLEFSIDSDGIVTLKGQVVRPATKADAEGVIRKLEGTERVINELEVLPPSPADERLRLALYRAIFGRGSPLFRYSLQAVPPIHIIVKNGRAWLKGVVATEQDSQFAYVKARGVSGLFEVKNELRIEGPR